MLLTNKQFATINTCLQRSVYLPIFGDDVDKFTSPFFVELILVKEL